MFNEKPYVVPQRAVNALFGNPEMDSAVSQVADFVKDFVDVETGFLDLDAAKGDVASIAVLEGNSWRHLAAEVDRDGTANDNRRPGKGDGSVAA